MDRKGESDRKRERALGGGCTVGGKLCTHSHTAHTKPLKDTFPAKPKVILTPGEVLFWHINLGWRKEMKILRSHLSLPQVSERERDKDREREMKREPYQTNGDKGKQTLKNTSGSCRLRWF